MGPKGYRICWLGKDKEKMHSVFQNEGEKWGDLYFLSYPGSGKDLLKEIYPSFFLVDTEALEGYRRDLLRWIADCREASPHGKILLLAYNGNVGNVPEALQRGADWVFPGTDDRERLRFMLEGLILLHKAEREAFHSLRNAASGFVFEEMIGRTSLMKDLFRLIRKCARSRANVLIRGESGTGKELVARALHRLSGRTGELVVINCASLMDSLHQSELFGHERGAFTDAKSRRAGYFEAAKGGTLFLDEIGDISMQTQVALLRALEGREYFRVGGCEPIHVDVRIVSATHQNLEDKVEKGMFREDLYYRLNGFCLTIPPLRERKEDIPLFVVEFLMRYAKQERKPVTGFTPEAMDLMTTYRWPGNVRELENEIQRLLIYMDSERTIASDMLLPPINILKNLPSYKSAETGSLKTRMQQAEAFFIKEALKKRYGNRTRTAEHLGISREGLHKKMARYRIR